MCWHTYSWIISETLPLLPLKILHFLFFSSQFHFLMCSVRLAFLWSLLLCDSLVYYQRFPCFLSFLVRLLMRLSLFSFYCFFPLSITISICPTFLIRKHCIYSLRSHCFSFFSKKINKIKWCPATGLEASPIDFSRWEDSLKSTASHCLATWAPRASGYYSDDFPLHVLAQRNASEQLPLQNRGSQGFPPSYFIPSQLKRGKIGEDTDKESLLTVMA